MNDVLIRSGKSGQGHRGRTLVKTGRDWTDTPVSQGWPTIDGHPQTGRSKEGSSLTGFTGSMALPHHDFRLLAPRTVTQAVPSSPPLETAAFLSTLLLPMGQKSLWESFLTDERGRRD